jgi:hypothetical protein
MGIPELAYYDITRNYRGSGLFIGGSRVSANVPSESEMNGVCLSTFSFPACPAAAADRQEKGKNSLPALLAAYFLTGCSCII